MIRPEKTHQAHNWEVVRLELCFFGWRCLVRGELLVHLANHLDESMRLVGRDAVKLHLLIFAGFREEFPGVFHPFAREDVAPEKFAVILMTPEHENSVVTLFGGPQDMKHIDAACAGHAHEAHALRDFQMHRAGDICRLIC